MRILFSLLILGSPGAHLESLLSAHGWGPVSVDQSVVRAANELARRIGRSRRGREPNALGKTVQFLMAKHDLSDATVTPFIMHHHKSQNGHDQIARVLARLERRTPPTHYGVGQHTGADRATTVILLVHRGVVLKQPLPRALSLGEKIVVKGRLRRGYFRPRVLIAPPHGRPVHERPAWTAKRSVEAEIETAFGTGPYGIEIVADSQYGPVVLNNHIAYVGVEAPQMPVVRLTAPHRSESQVGEKGRLLSALNRHRSEHGVSVLQEDNRLTQAALEHATEMARRKTVSHTSPNTGNLVMRLRGLGLDPVAVAENLAEASDASAAMHAFQDSPGHARNLILPGMTHVGIAVVGRYYAITLARLPESRIGKPAVDRMGPTK